MPKQLGKESLHLRSAWTDQADERARGVTGSLHNKRIFTDNYHYSIIDAPGHRDFIKNMITGASQADVALIMVPADGNFTASIADEIIKQVKFKVKLVNMHDLDQSSCVKQVIIGVNKMDSDVAKYSEERYTGSCK